MPENQKENKVKVLYIAGQGRSGSTILGNTLGQVEGFAHVGEFLEIWRILTSGQVSCGCGVPVVTCKVWEDVLKEAFGGRDESRIALMLKFRNLEASDRSCLPTLISRVRDLRERLAEPLAELEKVYRAIGRVFNCSVIVDSSKHSMYAYLLQLVDGIDPYVLHLTRDPRGSAYSFLRKRIKDGGLTWTKDQGPLYSSLQWGYQNSVIELQGRRFRRRPLWIRYEDFVLDPQASLCRILDFVGEVRSSLPLQSEYGLNLEPQHTMSGNPTRFVTGKVELRESDDWKAEMKARDQVLVTAVTWPLLVRYGYPFRPEHRRTTHSNRHGAAAASRLQE